MRALTLAAGLVILGAVPVRAEKTSSDFRAEFERVFRKGRTFAVVVQPGVPTVSINGDDGKTKGTAHFSVDVTDGHWTPSQGLLDLNQTARDTLEVGEIMELDSISYKENRVDLRMVSLEARKVNRGVWILKDVKREPVATNFKFFFPFRANAANDVPKAIEYIGEFLKPFPTASEAREFASRLTGGPSARARLRETEPPRARASSGATASGSSSKKEIKTGMTPLEVLDILGKPQKEVTFENKSRWTYPDLTVVFENGRVKEVRF
jgi:hypothetical protein